MPTTPKHGAPKLGSRSGVTRSSYARYLELENAHQSLNGRDVELSICITVYKYGVHLKRRLEKERTHGCSGPMGTPACQEAARNCPVLAFAHRMILDLSLVLSCLLEAVTSSFVP